MHFHIILPIDINDHILVQLIFNIIKLAITLLGYLVYFSLPSNNNKLITSKKK